MKVPPLRTPRLELRAYLPADRAAFVATYTSPEVMSSVDGALTDAAAGALFDDIYAGRRPRVRAAWCAVHEGETVGHGALLREDESLEIGYILPRSSWGHGYATEIARALVEYARETLGAPQVLATVDVDNAASIRVLQKIGMTLIERVEDPDGPYLKYKIDGAP